MTSNLQRYAQWLFSAIVIVLSLWILQSFIAPLTWAIVIALATWPLYKKFASWFPAKLRKNAAPIVFTIIVGALFIAPLVYAFIQIGVELQLIVRILIAAEQNGLPAPEWVSKVPMVGDWVKTEWDKVLGTPGGVVSYLGHIDSGTLLTGAKEFGRQMLSRSVILLLTLLVLFFLYRDGEYLSRKILDLGKRSLGTKGEKHAEHAVKAIRASVNGLVLIAIAQGILMGIAYAIADVPSATILGALTGVLAMIPFAAPLILAGVVLFLYAQGFTLAAILMLIWGILILGVADQLLRPILIGESIKLPFIWVFLGILGGLEAFGLLGLFLGPVIMAMGVALWREWTESSS